MSLVSDERVEQLLELEKKIYALEDSESCELITLRTEIAGLRAALAEAERERDDLRENMRLQESAYRNMKTRAERAEALVAGLEKRST